LILSVNEEVGRIEQGWIQLALGRRLTSSFCRALELGWAGINRVAVDGLQKSIEFLGNFALRFEKSAIRSTLVLESKRSLKGSSTIDFSGDFFLPFSHATFLAHKLVPNKSPNSSPHPPLKT
jgi:hypothetical protein